MGVLFGWHMNTVEPETTACLLATVRGGYADVG